MTIVSAIFALSLVFCHCSATLGNPGTAPVSRDAVVELLLVCDIAFVALFNNDKEQIYKFWSTQIWDVNIRLKTLPQSNIQVRVVDIVLLQKVEEQPFIENLNRTGDFTQPLLYGFAEWLFEKENTLCSFDVAMLITSVNRVAGFFGRTYHKTVCNPVSNYLVKKHQSSSFLFHTFPYGLVTSFIAENVAYIIGAEFDSKTECNSTRSIMSNYRTTIHRFFYSNCTDNELYELLHKKDAQCLYQTAEHSRDVLKPFLNIVPPSLDEQCKIVTNMYSAFARKTIDRCVETSCDSLANATTTFRVDIIPVDNSPCGEQHNCFRGRCLSRGYQLQNLLSDQCIHSTNIFIENDDAIATRCSASPTPLDTLRLEDNDSLGKRLMTPFTRAYTTETLDKCLTVNASTLDVHYKLCERDSVEYWSFRRARYESEKFLLFHLATKSCLFVDASHNLKANQTCDFTNKSFLWMSDGIVVPEKYLDTIGEYAADGELVLPSDQACKINETEKWMAVHEKLDDIRRLLHKFIFLT